MEGGEMRENIKKERNQKKKERKEKEKEKKKRRKNDVEYGKKVRHRKLNRGQKQQRKGKKKTVVGGNQRIRKIG